MEDTKTVSISVDKLGVWASSLCAVHCLATPLLLSLSAVFAHLLPGEERTHRTLAVLVAMIGGLALIRGFRVHGRVRIIVLMLCGMFCIFLGAYFGDRLPSHKTEILVTLTGSIMMIVAHRLNHTFCGDCRRCVSESK